MSTPSTQTDTLSDVEHLLKSINSVSQNTELLTDDDVPLDEPGVAETGARSGSQKFEGSEHRAIGDDTTLSFMISGKIQKMPSAGVALKKVSGTNLTYGRTISMAGDFYTNRGSESWFMYHWDPISGAFSKAPTGTFESRFNNMVDCMLTDYGGYIKGLNSALDNEKVVIDSKKGSDGGGEAQAFHSGKGLTTDTKFTLMTEGRYPRMAYQNADHFGKDALCCYKVGHALACNAAILAGRSTDENERDSLLKTAYFIEATSNHYLTDIFSTGHIRTPRRAFHYDSYETMAKVGPFEVPFWDTMSRFMHDDDSATGLMFNNARGEQWIAFGDKQLFMPANGSNRVRCVYTVQTSIDEVFWYFQNPGGPNNQAGYQVSRDTEFRTLALIPLPFANSKSDDTAWSSTLMLNPAPLWVPETNDVSKTQPWMYRQQYNNHAAYIFAEGHPGFANENAWMDLLATPEGYAIKAAPFRGDDQFPTTKTIEVDAGLLQLGQTVNTFLRPTDKGDSLQATCWSPIRFPSVPYADIPKSITLRSKLNLYNQSIDQGALTPLVHAMGWFDGLRTIAVLFQQPLADFTNPARLTASVLSFADPNQGKADQFNLNLSGDVQKPITVQTLWLNKPIFSQPFASGTSLTMIDFRAFKFVDSQVLRPMLMSVVCDPKGVYYSRTYLDNAENSNSSQAMDWTKKNAPSDPDWPARPFVKAAKGPSKWRGLFFCQRSAILNNAFTWRASALRVTDAQGGSQEMKWMPNWPQPGSTSIPLRCPTSGPYSKVRSACFLVGDIIGAAKWPIVSSDGQCDQIATITLSPTYTQIDVSGWKWTSDGQPSTCQPVCQHTCADDLTHGGPSGVPYDGAGYLRDYLIGLVPSQFGPTAGLDVVHVALHKVGDKYFLKFTTHVNDRATRPGGVPVPNRKETDYFGACNVSWVADELMARDRYESGRYQSLKWLYMPHLDKEKKHALMEVFSWYGILGFRYFAATWDGTRSKYDYKLVGVQPYNGQPSMTVGRGFYGTWGEGFVRMYGGSPEDGRDFVDVNYYNMVQGGDVGHGYWDSANKDTAKWPGDNVPTDPVKLIKRESDYTRGQGADVTKLEK